VNLLYVSLRPVGILLVKMLFRLRVTGQEHLPRRGAFILASNHVSYLDPVILGAASPRTLRFMARADLFRNPLFALLIRGLNAFSVKRDEQDPASIRLALHHLRRGEVVVVFPEGGRSKSGDLEKGRPGIGLLAAHAKVPVIPVYLSGTDKALPRQARFIRCHPVRAHFGAPLFFESSSPDHRRAYQAFAEQVMTALGEIKALTK